MPGSKRAHPAANLAQAFHWACLAEVLAPKAGNVHPGAAFADVDWTSFAISGQVSAQPISRAAELGVGRAVHDAARATRQAVGSNTNLGILLLCAPLAAAIARVGKWPAPVTAVRRELARVLAELTPTDARLVYAAIRLAKPGGLGKSQQHDVRHRPPRDLLRAMQQAAERDLIARQYVTRFADVFRVITPSLSRRAQPLDQAIIDGHLEALARWPDSLIARKRGLAEAQVAQRRAQAVLDAGGCATPLGQRQLRALDRWLRAVEHQRNPGTSADLLAAGLLVVFAAGRRQLPTVWAGAIA